MAEDLDLPKGFTLKGTTGSTSVPSDLPKGFTTSKKKESSISTGLGLPTLKSGFQTSPQYSPILSKQDKATITKQQQHQAKRQIVDQIKTDQLSKSNDVFEDDNFYYKGEDVLPKDKWLKYDNLLVKREQSSTGPEAYVSTFTKAMSDTFIKPLSGFLTAVRDGTGMAGNFLKDQVGIDIQRQQDINDPNYNDSWINDPIGKSIKVLNSASQTYDYLESKDNLPDQNVGKSIIHALPLIAATTILAPEAAVAGGIESLLGRSATKQFLTITKQAVANPLTKVLTAQSAGAKYSESRIAGKGVKQSLIESGKAGLEGAKSGITLGAQMGLAHSIAKNALLGGVAISPAKLSAMATGLVFGGTSIVNDLLTGKDVNIENATHELLVGIAFEVPGVAKETYSQGVNAASTAIGKARTNKNILKSALKSTNGIDVIDEVSRNNAINNFFTSLPSAIDIANNVIGTPNELWSKSLNQGEKAYESPDLNQKNGHYINQITLQKAADIKYVTESIVNNKDAFIEAVDRMDIPDAQKADYVDRINDVYDRYSETGKVKEVFNQRLRDVQDQLDSLGKQYESATTPANKAEIAAKIKLKEAELKETNKQLGSFSEQVLADSTAKVDASNQEIELNDFVDRIKAGEDINSPEDIQYYDANKKEIEDRLGKENITQSELEKADLNEFVERVKAGEKFTSTDDIDYFNENKDLINAKIEEDAIQKQSTSGQVPYTGEAGQVITKGSEGVGQGQQGQKAPQEITTKQALKEGGVYVLNGEKGDLIQDGETLTFETKDKIIELGNVNELSDQKLSDLGIEKEMPVDNIEINENLNPVIDGVEYMNSYSNKGTEANSAIEYDKEGNVLNVTLEDAKGNKRVFRGQQAEEIAYKYKLNEFERNATPEQIERAIAKADEAIATEAETKPIESKKKARVAAKPKVKTQEGLSPEITEAQAKLGRAKSDASKKRLTKEVKDLSTPEEFNQFIKDNPEYSKYDTTEEAKPTASEKVEPPKSKSDEMADDLLNELGLGGSGGDKKKPEAPEGEQQEQTEAPVEKYTIDNIDAINTNGLNEVQTKVLNDVKNIVKAVTNLVKSSVGKLLEINVHRSGASYERAVIEAGGTIEDATSKGFYLGSDGTIHLNMNAVTSETGPHEGFHPVLDYMAKHNPKIIDDLYTQLSNIKGGAEIIKAIEAAYSGSDLTTLKKEAITDFIAKVADKSIVITKSNFEQVKKFILDALNKLGISYNKDITNVKDLVELADLISSKFAKGEEIKVKDVESYVDKAETSNSSEGTDINFSLGKVIGSSNRGVQFAKDSKNKLLTKSKDPEGKYAEKTKKTLESAMKSVIDFRSIPNTEISRTLFYDNTKVGKLNIKNSKTNYTPNVEGKGGFFYSYLPEALANKAVLAFTSANQAIQTLKRQLKYPNSSQAIAAQNFLTAHLGNKSTLKALFGEKGSKELGIFQQAVKNNPAGQAELLKSLVDSTMDIANKKVLSGKKQGQPTSSALEITKIIERNGGNLDNIKTLDDFRDKVLTFEGGDSFGARNILFTEVFQNKPTKVSKSTREAHQIMHYKYGIPTLSEIAEGNNQKQLNNAETGDVIKLVKPYTDPIIYTTNKDIFKQYSENPTKEMVDNGISIELLPEDLHHDSYHFVLKGENVGILDNYIAAPQMYQKHEGIKDVAKKQSFYNVGRMPSEAPAGEFPSNPVSEGQPQFSKGGTPDPLFPDKLITEDISAESLLKSVGLEGNKLEEWKEKNKIGEGNQQRVPSVQQSAIDLKSGKTNLDAYIKAVRNDQPIIAFQSVPRIPSIKSVVGSLKSNQLSYGIVGVNVILKDGALVALRLDIPAYNNYNKWIVSIHDGRAFNDGGRSIAYAQTGVVTNVNFLGKQDTSLKIATGDKSKSPIARIFGSWKNEDPKSVHDRADKVMKEMKENPEGSEWVQVGMNPFRHSWFYDKADGNPVVSAEEVIQVGALVLAKNAKKLEIGSPEFVDMFSTKNDKGEVIQFSKGENMSKIQDFVTSQREKGVSDADIKLALEKVADKVGINKYDIQSLVAAKANKTTIRNADVEQKRADYGFDEPLQRKVQTNPETLEMAEKEIRSGADVNEIINKAKQRVPLTAVEETMLGIYQANKEAELIEANYKVEDSKNSSVFSFNETVKNRDAIIDDLLNAFDASEATGNVLGLALQARKIKVQQDYSLANMIIKARQANYNQNLSNYQVNKVTKAYNDLLNVKNDLDARIKAVTEENNALKLKQNLYPLFKQAEKEGKSQTKEQLKTEREGLFKQIADLFKGGGNKKPSVQEESTTAQFSKDNPIQPELYSVLANLAKNYFKGGLTNIADVVEQLHTDLSGSIEGLTRAHIEEALINEKKDARAPKEEVMKDLQDSKKELQKILDNKLSVKKASLKKRIAEATKNIKDNTVSKKKRGEPVNDAESLSLEQELKALQKDLKELASPEEKEQARLDTYKKSLEARIEGLSKKIKNKDYSRPKPSPLTYDKEALILQKKYADLKFDFEVGIAKEKLAKRTTAQKFIDAGLEIMNLPRALMASADLSAPLRQGLIPTISHPVLASQAFLESLKQAVKPERYDRWLSDLKHSNGYQLMKSAGLYLADAKNPDAFAREEMNQSNYAEKIPYLGQVVKGSERAYTSYLNRMRVELFDKGVNVLEIDGKTYASHPEAYKALARYLNAVTGRGDLGAIEGAAKYLNPIFFSPRLIVARTMLLTQWANPKYYQKTPPAVRRMYLEDMSKFIGFTIGLLGAAAYAGADVETDPRSSDFGKIRIGDTRYDTLGGFQQFIRYSAQLAMGEKKSSASGKITPLDGTNYTKETRATTIGNFFRSKLAPVPALAWNALAGENMIGDRFDVVKELPKNLIPLVWQGVYESANQNGWGFALTANLVPSILGVGVQTYGINSFLKQGIDDESIKLLISKKAIAVEPKEHDKMIYDVKTGEDRDMTSAEFEKYYATWANYIRENLKENHDTYAEMSNEKFEDKFQKMKTQASTLAKETLTGITESTKKVQTTENGSQESHDLTPQEIRDRKDANEQFMNSHRGIYSAEFRKQLKHGKSAAEASYIAKHKLESAANAFTKKKILKRHKQGRGYYFND